MKVNIEIDLTPEEARRLAGLPDYEQVHNMFLKTAADKMKSGESMIDVEPMVKAWSGLGGIAQDAFNAFIKASVEGSKMSFDTSPKSSSDDKDKKAD